MNSGVAQLNYLPTSLGAHKITAVVTASDGAKITRVIDLVVDNVPFTLNATATATTINVNQELNINLELAELQKNISSTYELTHSFDAKGISGTVKNSLNSTVLNAGAYTSITPGTYVYKFKAATQGVATLTFKIKDSNGQIKETSLTITVSNVPFTFTGTSTEKTILLNQNSKLNFNIVPNTTDSAGVIYNMVYQGEAGDGILSDADGKIIQRGTPVTVTKGIFSFNYKPTSLGSQTLNFTVTDNNGESRIVKIEMESVHTPVTFNVSSVTQTYVNQGVTVDFIITPQLSSNLTYELNYYVSGGQGVLKNYDTVIKAGEYASVQKGSFKYNFLPSIAGNYTLSFQLKDSNGQIITKDVSLIVLNNQFSFTPTASQKVFVNENNVFSYALVPTGNYAGTTYNVSYTIEAGQLGTFYNNGTELQQGIPISVTPTSFNLIYKPTSKGEHKIHYTVTDSNGLKTEVIQSINVIATDFNLKVQQANQTLYKNNSDVVLLSLSQEQVNPNIGYSMTYTLTGVGALYNNGVEVPSFGAIVPGNMSLSFLSKQAGNTEIVFNVVDTNGIQHTKTIKYTTINADFNLSSSGDGTINVNKSKDFNVYLSQLIPDPTATYQIKYTLDSGSVGSGKVFYGSSEVPFGTYQNVNIGTTQLSFKGLSAGNVNLKVEVKDSNGVIHSSTVLIDIAPINYTFSAATQNNSIYLNGTTPLNFDISENAISGTTYEMKYVITAGEGQIKNGSNTENANTWYPVSIGSFNRTFVGNQVGEIKILFTVRNTTTLVEKTQLATINVNASDFNFNATATDNDQTIKTPINVNLNLTQTGGGTEIYSMTFSSSGTGTFNYNGSNYSAGQLIPITVGASNGSYKGTTPGEHNIIFTIVNQNSVQKTANVKINYQANDFSLTTTGDGTLNANTTKSFNTFVSQGTTDSSITYQAKFVVASGSTGGGTISQNGNNVSFGTYQTIAVGNTGFVFKGTSPGTVNIEVTVKDSNGITHTSTVAMEVLAINYTFTGAAQNGTIYVNGTTPLNFDVTETAPSGTTYEMKYVITEGTATLKNGISQESANTWYPVPVGAFNRTFIGSATGTVKLTYTVRNTTTLVEKTQTITINVSASDYTFTATATDNNLTAKTPINVNLNLTQTGGGTETYSMTYSTTGTGTLVYNGTTYTAGQLIPITVGSNTAIYKGTTTGNHDVTFTVISQNSVQKTATIKLTYVANDFTLSTSGDGSLNANTTKSFNTFVSQNNTDTGITYEAKFNVVSGSTGDGTISQNGNNVPFGTYQTIAVGNTGFVFKGLTAGTVNIQITVKDSNGITHTSTVAMEVLAINYTFTGAPQNNSIYVNGTTPINFDISESATSGTQYEMKYVITEGTATIKNGSNVESANTWANVPIGSFNRTFAGTTTGSIKITFTVRNKTTLVEKTQQLTIAVNAADFNITATATDNNQISKTPINVNLNLTQTGGSGTETYTMSFSTTGTGTFTYGGIDYSSGQTIPITVGLSNGSYKGTSAGNHDIIFTVKNENNVSKTSAIKLTYINNDFNFSTSGDGTVNQGTNKNFYSYISQNVADPAITYQLKYTIDSGTVGDGEIYYNGTLLTQGNFITIPKNSSTLVFKGLLVGAVNIKLEVKDSNGITHNSVVMFDVKPVNFTITSVLDKPTLVIGEPNQIITDITEDYTSNTAYEIKYTNNSGTFDLTASDFTVISNNVWYNITGIKAIANIIGSNNSNVDITVSVRNKISQTIKTVRITKTPYQKPNAISIVTRYTANNPESQGRWDRHFLISYGLTKDATASIESVSLFIYDQFGVKNFYPLPITATISNHEFQVYGFAGDNASDWNHYQGQQYDLVIKDTNGYTTTITKTFTNTVETY